MSSRAEIPRQLGVQAPALSASREDSAIRGKVTVHRDHLFFQRGRADQVQKEALATTVLTDHEANGGPAIHDALQVSQ